MQKRPLKVNVDFFNLVTQGQVPAELVNFNNISIPSERTVTINDYKTDGTGQLITIDLKSFEINKRAIKQMVYCHTHRRIGLLSEQNRQTELTQLQLFYII
jgi:hypothetical protein